MNSNMDTHDLEKPLVGEETPRDDPNDQEDDRYLNSHSNIDLDLTINSGQPDFNHESEIHSDDNDQDEESDEDDKQYEEYVNSVSRADKQSIIGQELTWRNIKVNISEDLQAPENVFLSNEIHTSKYTILTFLPK